MLGMRGNSHPHQKHHRLELGGGSFGRQDQRRQGALSWLHISDIHFHASDSYSRKVVLKALIEAMAKFRRDGQHRPDLIFVTGDIAQSGSSAEYERATEFFDALLSAAELDKSKLFVVPGNHDVDRILGEDLARSLADAGRAERFFSPDKPKPHITVKQGAFAQWFDGYFAGMRAFPRTSTCGPVEIVAVNGRKIGILPLNSALFCQDEHDHSQLWLGRQAVDEALEQLRAHGADINVALIHHPLDWLHDGERSNIKAMLAGGIDVLLRGHLHDADGDQVAAIGGTFINLAAGATYQTVKYPNIALYVTVEDTSLAVHPIKYEDKPNPCWVPYLGLFSNEPSGVKHFWFRDGSSHRSPPQSSPSPVTTPVSIGAHDDSDTQLKRLKGDIAEALRSSTVAMNLLEHFLGLTDAADGDRAQAVTEGLMGLNFENGWQSLLKVHNALDQTNERPGRDVIVRVSRLLIPFLFVAGQENEFGPLRQTNQGYLMGVPAGTHTIAEIAMAGLSRREVSWKKIEGDRPFPQGNFGAFQRFLPEAGTGVNWETAMRDELFLLVKPPADAPRAISIEDKDKAINDGLQYWMEEKGVRIYLILDPPDSPDDAPLFEKQVEHLQKRYKLLALLRLDPKLWTPHTRLFDQIRPLMVAAHD